MRLIRDTPVHRINLRARINLANRDGSPCPPQAAGTPGRDANTGHVDISYNRLLAVLLMRARVYRGRGCAGRTGVRTYNSAVADAEGGAFELGTDGPKVILVGVDDSVTSMRAGAYAAGLARRQGARLVCVYVERPSAMYGAAAGAGAGAIAAQQQALDEMAAALRREAEEGARRLGLALTFVVARGDPYTELRRVADEVRADAVIVGASMQAGHRWIGSLAVRLVKAGRWPVTVVP